MRLTVRLTLTACCLGPLAVATPAAAQGAAPPEPLQPLSRTTAVATALGRAARLGVARADSALARAALLLARTRQNPTLTGEYTRSAPQYHVTAELPIDLPGLRAARIRAAQAGREAAGFRLALARALVALDADTSYTRALAARERMRLSRRNADAADSLRTIAERRRDAGDASDLDVDLASVNAGQQANVAASDSLAYASALLDLQAAMGLTASDVSVAPGDSLTAPPTAPVVDATATDPSTAAPALPVAAARASLQAAEQAARAERRGTWGSPSVTAGFETGDPRGDERGVLPTVGIAVPLPLLGRNQGAIAQADAERARAAAELALAEVESRVERARARRTLAVALDRVRRDRQLVLVADRVASRSLTAYREGASPLPSVLEAQRNARDVLAQYVADLADAWIATATLRVLTLTAAPR